MLTKRQFWQTQSFQRQSFLWPFKHEITPLNDKNQTPHYNSDQTVKAMNYLYFLFSLP